MISLVIEPVASESKGFEVDSTGEMLAKINEVNDKLSNEFPNECPDQIGCMNASSSVNDPMVLDSSKLGSIDAQSCESNSNLIKGSLDGLGCVNAPSCVNTNSEPNKCSEPIMSKNDIRAYGKRGNQTSNKPKMSKNECLAKQDESVRNNKPKIGVLPDMAERVLAGKLIDEMYGKKAIPVKKMSLIEKLAQKRSKNMTN